MTQPPALPPSTPHHSGRRAWRMAARRRPGRARGVRGPLVWPQTPSTLTRRQLFEDVVVESVETMERRSGGRLGVEVLVADVPDGDAGPWLGRVELTRELPAAKDGEPRLVIYRRPCETRARGEDELALLVHETLVEEVSRLTGRDPEDLDD